MKYECTIRQDAWIFYLCTVEADSAEEAAEIARHAWRFGEPKLTFTESGHDGFDHAECEVEDCQPIDDDGQPMEASS